MRGRVSLRFHPIGAGSAGLTHRPSRPILVLAALAAGALSFAGAGAATAAPVHAHHAVSHTAKPRPTPRVHVDYKRACPVVTKPGKMACMVLERTNVAHIAPHTL